MASFRSSDNKLVYKEIARKFGNMSKDDFAELVATNLTTAVVTGLLQETLNRVVEYVQFDDADDPDHYPDNFFDQRHLHRGQPKPFCLG
jgi:hypothetical protein